MNFFTIVKWFLLFTSPLLVQLKDWLLLILLSGIYTLEMGVSVREVLDRGLRKPKFTAKASAIFALALTFELAWGFLSRTKPPAYFGLSLLILDKALPLLVFALVFLFRPLTLFLKKAAILAAKNKIKSFPQLLVIGVTGSYGKTSTKEFLAQVLLAKYKVLKTPGTKNVDIGVAKLVLSRLRADHQVFVVEMGAYKKGEIRTICEITNPKIGIITGINEQHLALFGTIEDTQKAKFELVESLPPDGLAVFNKDNPHCQKLAQKAQVETLLYSTKEKADVYAQNIQVKKNGLEFEVVSGQEKEKFKTPLLGRPNIENILAAVCVARHLGMELQEIAQEVSNLRPVPHTMEICRGFNNSLIIDDSYNTNPAGFTAALEFLKLYRDQKKIVVTPGIIELGPASQSIHQKLGALMAEVCDRALITSRNFSSLIQEGMRSVGSKPSIVVEESPKKLVDQLSRVVDKDDVVLLEGRVPSWVVEKLIKHEKSF